MKLPTLYKISTTGATQIIDMEIIDAVYTRTWGQLDGKMQTKATTAKGKNLGKSNESTPAEQAILEAEAVWTKKQKANYSTSQSAPVAVNLPMKVKSLLDQIKNVVYPCVSTPKLNGVNSTYRLVNNILTLTSRGGETYHSIPHLEDEVREAMTQLHSTELNGELYIHGEHLQDITSAVKKPKELSKRLTFNIFDIADSTADYETRRELMLDAEAILLEDSKVLYLTGLDCDSMYDIEVHYNQCMEAGLEGTVVKNLNGLYKYNTRSTAQFKYKKTQDAEFLVCGYEIDKNGHAVFKCVVDSFTFKVKLKGTNEERLAMAADADNYIGKHLKVEYEMLSKDGIPLKPVGIIFRKVDENGEAIE